MCACDVMLVKIAIELGKHVLLKSILDTLLTVTYIHFFIHLYFTTCSRNHVFNVLLLAVEFLLFPTLILASLTFPN